MPDRPGPQAGPQCRPRLRGGARPADPSIPRCTPPPREGLVFVPGSPCIRSILGARVRILSRGHFILSRTDDVAVPTTSPCIGARAIAYQRFAPLLKLPPTILLECQRSEADTEALPPCQSGNLGRRFWPPSMGLLVDVKRNATIFNFFQRRLFAFLFCF
jgi:hypothetical protein